jgi:hypothetical protein
MGQVSYAELFRTATLPRGAWIFAGLEALTAAELRMAHQAQCTARDAGLPVLNPALKALRRYDLLELLHRSGRNSFRAHPADGPLGDVRYPVFVRLADEHNGSLTPLLNDRAALRRAMAYLWMRGLASRQLLVVEFCDTAGGDGLYRKYSVFRIGDTYVPRYLHIGTHWMTKDATSGATESMISEEMAYLRQNPHAAWVRETFEMAHIEYGRLDYGVQDGRPQAWEINMAPVLAGDPNRKSRLEQKRTRELLYPARVHAHTALREAFDRIDPGLLQGDDIRVEFSPDLIEEARQERSRVRTLERRQGWIARIAAAPGFRRAGPLLRQMFGAEAPG